MLYNWNRDYDPALGRYVESDPIGLSGGINPYGYVGADPLIRLDLQGLTQHDVDVINNYISSNFPDIHRSGGYTFGDPDAGNEASTSPIDGITTLPTDVKCKKLNYDQFYELFSTMLHESMHSTDSGFQRAWDGSLYNNFRVVTSNHQAIYNRTLYETILGHRSMPSPIWGHPTGFIPDIKGLYNGSRANDKSCGCP